MTPRTPKGEAAMSSSERVRLSRWVNKVEAAADDLLDLLQTGPDPLPRNPVIDPELLDRLALFNLDQDDASEEDYPRVRFLKLGNGNQVSNKRRALASAIHFLKGAKAIDQRTIELPDWGTCHFSAFTHPKGAMISNPKKEDSSYGSADWHKRDHIVMFRDVGDGRCIVYICDIKPLFDMRTIGHGGVKWEAISRIAKHTEIISSSDALKAEAQLSSL